MKLTASHSAPMLYQVPDRVDIKLFQTSDQKTTLQSRGGSSRIDVIFERTVE